MRAGGGGGRAQSRDKPYINRKQQRVVGTVSCCVRVLLRPQLLSLSVCSASVCFSFSLPFFEDSVPVLVHKIKQALNFGCQSTWEVSSVAKACQTEGSICGPPLAPNFDRPPHGLIIMRDYQSKPQSKADLLTRLCELSSIVIHTAMRFPGVTDTSQPTNLLSTYNTFFFAGPGQGFGHTHTHTHIRTYL